MVDVFDEEQKRSRFGCEYIEIENSSRPHAMWKDVEVLMEKVRFETDVHVDVDLNSVDDVSQGFLVGTLMDGDVQIDMGR